MNLRLKAATIWRQGSPLALLVTLLALATGSQAEEADDNFYRCIPGMESVGGKTKQLHQITAPIEAIEPCCVYSSSNAVLIRYILVY